MLRAMEEAQTSPEPINVPAPILAGDFAGWLREAMQARGVSQRMLGLISGIDHSTISRLLSGDREPTLGTALALIRVLERPRLRMIEGAQAPDSGER
jgi:transcriptional regulator with XRE-family HTH domain